MPSVAVLGAGGLIGGLVAADLAARGHDVVGIGRETARVASTLTSVGVEPAAIRTADATDAASVEAAIESCDLVVNTIAPMADAGRAVAEVACAASVHLVDVGVEQRHMRAVHAIDELARTRRVTVVPGAGFQHLIGDVLAHLAATAVDAPTEVHVAYALPDRGSPLAVASAGRRSSVAAELGSQGVALEHGAHVEELPGEARRLAWFPRPIGPAHAAAIPAGEAISVPRHVPGIEVVRTYLAVAGWRAELLQATANAARWAPARRRLVARLTRRRAPVGPARRATLRWACVAETRGADGVARAWAYGHDPYRATAVAASSVAGVVLDGRAPAGVLAPAEVAAPGELLDGIAAVTDLRWSISRPDAP